MLLVIPLKTTSRYDISIPLAKWIDMAHPQMNSRDCRDDLKRLASLRHDLSAELLMGGHANAVARGSTVMKDLAEYHACLWECERRGFPVRDESWTLEQQLHVGLQLHWKVAFATPPRPKLPDDKKKKNAADEDPSGDETRERCNVRYERCCVLFNYAALLQYRACVSHMQQSREGRVDAMKDYAAAASCFSALRNHLLTDDPDPPADLCAPTLLMVESLCRAQGQLCAYEAAMDRATTPPGLAAKLSAGVAEYYDACLEESQDPLVRARLPQTSTSWGSHFRTLSMLYRATSEFHEAAACFQRSQYGLDIARLRQAEFMVKSAQEFYQGPARTNLPRELYAHSASEDHVLSTDEKLSVLLRTVVARKAEAETANARIYMDAVPLPTRKLDRVKGQGMMTRPDESNAKGEMPKLPDDLYPEKLKRKMFQRVGRPRLF